MERRVFLIIEVTKIAVPSVEGTVSNPVICNYLSAHIKISHYSLLLLCILYFAETHYECPYSSANRTLHVTAVSTSHDNYC